MDQKRNAPELIGLVFIHPDGDYEGWQVNLSEEAQEKIYKIIQPYLDRGCSTIDCKDCKVSEVF